MGPKASRTGPTKPYDRVIAPGKEGETCRGLMVP